MENEKIKYYYCFKTMEQPILHDENEYYNCFGWVFKDIYRDQLKVHTFESIYPVKNVIWHIHEEDIPLYLHSCPVIDDCECAKCDVDGYLMSKCKAYLDGEEICFWHGAVCLPQKLLMDQRRTQWTKKK